ncbi:MAG: hypothetical protein QOG50_275 [Actinomycetota bacterium]|jgi:hypothetical protein|nr:hypothetical protein [Actinomycetota bacterium]
MYLKHKLIGAAAVLVAFAGIGTATALAQSSTTSPAPKAPPSVPVNAKTVEPKSATDTDNVQQGDQNGPDVAAASESPDPLEASAPSAKTSAASEGENTTETETASDGPGGHADRPGNVDHQFDGQE